MAVAEEETIVLDAIVEAAEEIEDDMAKTQVIEIPEEIVIADEIPASNGFVVETIDDEEDETDEDEGPTFSKGFFAKHK